MKGGGVAHTNGKWRTITRMMKSQSLSILALQETHLTEEHRTELERRYDRVRIISSPDPDNDSGKGGVAFLLNKYNTQWKDVEIEHTIPGRALTMKVTWGHGSSMRITAVYAPAGTAVEKAEFWTSLRDIWRRDRTKRPDVLMGDLNMVESALDRLPVRQDTASVVEPFVELRSEAKLKDGWQETHAGGKPRYTFRTRRRGVVNSRSRIDRIYVTDELFKSSYE
ncbi:hypothetical protein D9611_013115 [Ephemerocybe angulata]|uniref:Endonuclease/exonuclease/phosphatase domain-containing protein n=1 Tax=Ephemerocybe angulata TaxID=980116 RepID=A0A8H5BY78_9AGAR|nr:hypothetical protein D9611_013115 [Tulosesus angulatus]